MSMLLDPLATGIINSSGLPLDSGVAHIYSIGTTTPVPIYADSDLTDPLSNPVTLSAAGKAIVYVGESVRIVIEDSLGASIDDMEITFVDSLSPDENEWIANDNLLPEEDVTYSIGSLALRWLNAFIKYIFASFIETKALGAMVPGMVSNLGLTLSSGTLTVTDAEGSALTVSNYGYICAKSTTAGLFKILKVTAPATLNDDVHASSDMTNQGWGITESVDWANDMPFFLYVVNRSNSNIDGVDGSSCFFIARSPILSTTPASANNIHTTSALSGAADTQEDILLMGSFTSSLYTSLPCQLIGAVRMRWSTATDDWTIQTLGNKDGFGANALADTFATVWTMPAGQYGAVASRYSLANGGTAPQWTTQEYYYKIKSDGNVFVSVDLDGDGGTDGAGAVGFLLITPTVINCIHATSSISTGMARAVGAGALTDQLFSIRAQQGETSVAFTMTDGSVLNNSEFSAGTRLFDVTFEYRGFA